MKALTEQYERVSRLRQTLSGLADMQVGLSLQRKYKKFQELLKREWVP